MKSQAPPQPSQLIWLTCIHWVLALALPVVLLAMSGCLQAKQDSHPFGPEDSVNNVSSALDAPYSTISPSTIEIGEFVHIETNQSISGGSKFVTKDTGITVIDKTDTSDGTEYTLAEEEVDYNSDGTSNRSVFENTVLVPNSTGSSTQSKPSLAVLGMEEALHAASTGPQLCDAISDPSITYHNLKVTSGVVDAPDAVQGADFCSGKDPCQIDTTDISFDQVIWSGDQGQKVNCQYTFSDQVPFLASQLKQCITSVVLEQNQHVLVDQCAEVVDFQYGTGTTN